MHKKGRVRKMRRILVPIDDSDLSARALPIAMRLAQAQDAELVLVRVTQPIHTFELWEGPHHAFDLSDDEARSKCLEIAAREDLAALVDRMTGLGLAARFLVLTGASAPRLLDAEEEVQPDLVVMASHARSALERFALGSVSERLLREGAAPVLIVQAASPIEGPLDTALVPLDGSRLAELALPVVESLARKPLRQVQLFRTAASRDETATARAYLERIAMRLEESGLTLDIEVSIDEPAPAIATPALGADLVILATHGRGGLDRLRYGSVAEQVIHQVQTPTLLVRAA
jgi:nucleotide-binding universal stress UspA family protein